jgi:hypothetical protein
VSRVPRWLAVLLLLTPACSSPTEPSPDLRGGVLATFEVGQERFQVFVRNTAAIDRLFLVRSGVANGSIPNGRIRRGAGAAAHNAPRPWHLDPDDIEIADVAIEVCDGAPSYVDAHVDEYVSVIGRYCPWGARLVSIEDYR